MFRNYIEWKNFKRILDWFPFVLPCDVGELWWVAWGLNVGTEIDGKGRDYRRPALILKKYNENTLLLVPLSGTQNFKPDLHIEIFHPNLLEKSYLVINQTKTQSNNRLLERIGSLEQKQFTALLERIENNKT